LVVANRRVSGDRTVQRQLLGRDQLTASAPWCQTIEALDLSGEDGTRIALFSEDRVGLLVRVPFDCDHLTRSILIMHSGGS
jgi:hypothetical protein